MNLFKEVEVCFQCGFLCETPECDRLKVCTPGRWRTDCFPGKLFSPVQGASIFAEGVCYILHVPAPSLPVAEVPWPREGGVPLSHPFQGLTPGSQAVE